MKELFSIGDVASIMGISVQSLRSYCNMGLLKPETVDPQSGYRYFSFNQLHFIDKIKYLRKLGVPLLDIKAALEPCGAAHLSTILQAQRQKLLEERNALDSAIESLDWYINYFAYPSSYAMLRYPYIRRFPLRYAFGTACDQEEVSSVEIRLSMLRHSPEAQVFHYYRQYGYTADFAALKRGTFLPYHHYMFLKYLPESVSPLLAPHVLTFPAGDYLCFMEPLRNPAWDGRGLPEKLQGLEESQLVLANEYEDSLSEYGYSSSYEIQVLLRSC